MRSASRRSRSCASAPRRWPMCSARRASSMCSRSNCWRRSKSCPTSRRAAAAAARAGRDPPRVLGPRGRAGALRRIHRLPARSRGGDRGARVARRRDHARQFDQFLRPARRSAPSRSRRCLKKAIRRAKQLSELDTEQRHRLRIELKRLRYTAEFFAPLFPPKSVVAVPRALEQIAGSVRHVERCRDRRAHPAPDQRACGRAAAGRSAPKRRPSSTAGIRARSRRPGTRRRSAGSASSRPSPSGEQIRR